MALGNGESGLNNGRERNSMKTAKLEETRESRKVEAMTGRREKRRETKYRRLKGGK